MRAPNEFQGNGIWFANRIGKLTASRMRSAMKRLKNGDDSAERRDLKIEMLAERMTDQIVPKYTNEAMLWGMETEPEAKDVYEEVTGRLITDVGFMDHPVIPFLGASPDGFVDDGLIEIKCPTTSTHLTWAIDGEVPEEHKPQMIVQCLVTGRQWCDFVSYDPRVPESYQLFVRRFTPTSDERSEIEAEAVKFLAEVEEMFELITRQEMIK